MPIRRAVLAAPLLLLLLAGCVPTPEPTTGPESGSPDGPAVPVPTASVTATATPGPETEAVPFGCPDILSPQSVYDYNPNVGLLQDFAPEAGTLAGQAVALEGIACRLVNQTSGATIDVGVVRFTEAAYPAKLSSVAASSSQTGAFDGFFDMTADGGAAQAFSSPYWITIVSGDFVEAGDAAQLVEAVEAGIG